MGSTSVEIVNVNISNLKNGVVKMSSSTQSAINIIRKKDDEVILGTLEVSSFFFWNGNLYQRVDNRHSDNEAQVSRSVKISTGEVFLLQSTHKVVLSNVEIIAS